MALFFSFLFFSFVIFFSIDFYPWKVKHKLKFIVSETERDWKRARGNLGQSSKCGMWMEEVIAAHDRYIHLSSAIPRPPRYDCLIGIVEWHAKRWFWDIQVRWEKKKKKDLHQALLDLASLSPVFFNLFRWPRYQTTFLIWSQLWCGDFGSGGEQDSRPSKATRYTSYGDRTREK